MEATDHQILVYIPNGAGRELVVVVQCPGVGDIEHHVMAPGQVTLHAVRSVLWVMVRAPAVTHLMDHCSDVALK